MNIDEHPSIAGQLGIQSIPAVIAFKNGQPVEASWARCPKARSSDFIKRLGGGDGGKQQIVDALVAAKEALAAGEPEGAIAESTTRCCSRRRKRWKPSRHLPTSFEAGDLRGGARVLATYPEQKANAPEITAVKARITLAEETADLGDADRARAPAPADPEDHQARFDLAMIQNAAASARRGRKSSGNRQSRPDLEGRLRTCAIAEAFRSMGS